MKVICSGMSKTGTKSLAAALRILGYKVYDFEEQYFYIGKDLTKIMEDGWTKEDIQRIFKDVDAVTDIPGCMLWEDLLQAFPDAKVMPQFLFFILCSFSLSTFFVQMFCVKKVYSKTSFFVKKRI